MNSFQEVVEVCRLKMILDDYNSKKSVSSNAEKFYNITLDELFKLKTKFKKDMQKFYKMEKQNG